MADRPRSRGSAGWMAAAVAVAILVAAVVAIIVLNRPADQPAGAGGSPGATSATGESPGGSASPSVEPSDAPTESAVATPAPRDGWRAVPIADGGAFVAVNGVEAWHDGLIAFGRGEGVEGGIWLSADGETWEPAAVPSSPAEFAVFLTDVEPTDAGYVAVGTLGHPLGSGPAGSVIWTSTDGASWTEAPGFDATSGTILGTLAARSQTVVAAGSGLGASAVWISTDGGANWTEAEPPDGEAWGVSGLLAHDGGFIAAGGVGGNFDAPSAAAIWTSTDGLTWDRVDLDGETVTAVTRLTDGRFLAVGEGGNAVLAWLSDDGTEWAPTPSDVACCITDLASTPTGVVGVGFGPTAGGVVAATSDGVEWSSETGIEGALNQVIYHPRFGVVAGGATADQRPAVIFGPHPYP